jgi:ribosome-binding factor A
VFVSVLGDADAVASTMQALNEARPFIRREVGERTDLRFVPQIEFVSDASAARAARISQLLREATRDR